MAQPQNTPESVWNWIERGGDDECWPWRGTRNAKGYGVIVINHRRFYAHRVTFAVASGLEPGSLCVMHRCDNPPCCNPNHLRLGTLADNNRDCAAKRRTPLGERHFGAKLTTAAVREIRALHARGVMGKDLAARYGVSRASISHVVQRKNWSHV